MPVRHLGTDLCFNGYINHCPAYGSCRGSRKHDLLLYNTQISRYKKSYLQHTDLSYDNVNTSQKVNLTPARTGGAMLL